MAEYLGIAPQELIHKYYGRAAADGKHWISEDEKRKPCPFLVSEDGRKKACAIYPVRPAGCRAFPFDSDFGTNGVNCPAAAEVAAKLRKPTL
jgi:Fe-S-cluster containining protein